MSLKAMLFLWAQIKYFRKPFISRPAGDYQAFSADHYGYGSAEIESDLFLEANNNVFLHFSFQSWIKGSFSILMTYKQQKCE